MIEIEEYIRNKYGYIGKVKKIIKKDEYMHTDYYVCASTMASAYEDEITCHNKDIRKLIQEGDYVNGELVWLGRGGPVEEGRLFVGDLEHGYYLDEIKIDMFATKEQFAEICYDLEEDEW